MLGKFNEKTQGSTIDPETMHDKILGLNYVIALRKSHLRIGQVRFDEVRLRVGQGR